MLRALVVPLAVTLATGLAASGARAETPCRIVGYVLGTRDADFRTIDAARLTHLNYAFANVKDGRAVLESPEQDAARIAQLQSLRARNPRLKILLSIGGGEWSSRFSDMALAEPSRRAFVASATSLLTRYAFDGLDLDWEYPAIPGPSTVYRPEDTANFTALLRELRAALDGQSRRDGRSGATRYELSIAASTSEAFRNHVELALVHPLLDHLNVMAYDNVGPWTERTGHHANLRPVDPSLSPLSGVAGVEGFLAAGVPRQKIVLGLAFYGYSFADVDPERRGLYQRYRGRSEAVSYSDLLDRYIGKNGFTRYWDEVAEAPYLWNPETRTLVTYDDPESQRRKLDYVKSLGLGGVMYWEHFHDPSQTLLLGLDRGLHGETGQVPGAPGRATLTGTRPRD